MFKKKYKRNEIRRGTPENPFMGAETSPISVIIYSEKKCSDEFFEVVLRDFFENNPKVENISFEIYIEIFRINIASTETRLLSAFTDHRVGNEKHFILEVKEWLKEFKKMESEFCDGKDMWFENIAFLEAKKNYELKLANTIKNLSLWSEQDHVKHVDFYSSNHVPPKIFYSFSL